MFQEQTLVVTLRCRTKATADCSITQAEDGPAIAGVEAVCRHTKKNVDPIKKILFCYRKVYWGRQTKGKTRRAFAGSENEAHLSYKRRVTANFVQNDQKNIRQSEVKH